MNSWTLGIIVVVVLVGYIVLKNGKLKGKLKMPSIFTPKVAGDVTKIRDATAKEQERVDRLKEVLEAKRELMKARADSIKLSKEIAEVNERNVIPEEAVVAPPKKK